MIVSSAAAWVAVGFDIAEIRLLTRQEMGLATAGEKAAHSVIGEVVFQIQMTLLAATAIAFMTWLYRCRANLRAFGTRHLRYSRNWAVFGFLIPVVNLVRPYQVVREVWQASDPDTTDPLDWKTVKPPRLLRAWWATFVAFLVFKMLAWWMMWSAAYDLHAAADRRRRPAARRRPGGGERDPRLLRHRSHHRCAAGEVGAPEPAARPSGGGRRRLTAVERSC